MLEEKWLVPAGIPGQSPRYEVTGKAPHHQFQCNDCGKLFDLAGCEVSVKAQTASRVSREMAMSSLCMADVLRAVDRRASSLA